MIKSKEKGTPVAIILMLHLEESLLPLSEKDATQNFLIIDVFSFLSSSDIPSPHGV